MFTTRIPDSTRSPVHRRRNRRMKRTAGHSQYRPSTTASRTHAYKAKIRDKSQKLFHQRAAHPSFLRFYASIEGVYVSIIRVPSYVPTYGVSFFHCLARTPSTQHLVSSIDHATPSTKYQAPSIEHQALVCNSLRIVWRIASQFPCLSLRILRLNPEGFETSWLRVSLPAIQKDQVFSVAYNNETPGR